MKKLSVKSFSCINDANLEIGKITVIIGPQASGKSVLCKLVYFFNDISSEISKAISQSLSFENFKEALKEKFVDWFPPSAWGVGKFQITYSEDDFEVKLTRIIYKNIIQDNFRLTLPDSLKKTYEESLKKLNNDPYDRMEEAPWRADEIIYNSLNTILGSSRISSQIFIPAGRSFFTNMGKAVAAFEQGRMLDPLTVRFGRAYTNYKERILSKRFPIRIKQKDSFFEMKTKIASILGGSLKLESSREYVETGDGRLIPISALSSGQQEILPLFVVLSFLTDSSPRELKRLIYIEEPEAHLFPKSQSDIIELLSFFINRFARKTELIITTHSPYVLTKVNNLIKADQLSKSHPSKKEQINSIIPEHSWLNSKSIAAYSIESGILYSIVDTETSLIDADYLDSISASMSDEFTEMLALEYSDEGTHQEGCERS